MWNLWAHFFYSKMQKEKKILKKNCFFFQFLIFRVWVISMLSGAFHKFLKTYMSQKSVVLVHGDCFGLVEKVVKVRFSEKGSTPFLQQNAEEKNILENCFWKKFFNFSFLDYDESPCSLGHVIRFWRLICRRKAWCWSMEIVLNLWRKS